MCARPPSQGHDIKSRFQQNPSACWDGLDRTGTSFQTRWTPPCVGFLPFTEPVNADCVDESPSWRRASEATAAPGLPGYASVCVNAS